MLPEAAGVAAFALAAAVAVGAVALLGLRLGAPGLLPSESAGDALVHSTTLGLASLRVPLEAGDVTGALAPLTGAVAAVAAVADGTRRRRAGWTTNRRAQVAAVAAALACLCALLAWAGRGAELRASAGGAAIAGAAWGTVGALWGTSARSVTFRRTPSGTMIAAAGTLAAGWLTVVAVAAVVSGHLGGRSLAGMVPLAVAFAPNVVGALVALGCGARVDVALTYDGGALTSGGGISLWDWPGGTAPWYFVVLLALPLVAVTLGAVVSGPSLRRGLRNGLVLGGTLFAAGWAGAFEAGRGAGPDAAAFRLGIDLAPAFVLGVAWGPAGALVATVLGRLPARSRVTR